jgi:proteasome lid subunit RPN8/RPN11
MSAVATTSVRDIGVIEFHDWPLRELINPQGNRESRFQAVFKQSVCDEIHRHGQDTPDVEVCGVLVGRCMRDLRGPYLLIEHCIRANGAVNKSTAVTFTTDSWQHIHETMNSQHPDQTIVGWYHTHPGFGIFLSEMDVFICQNFFDLPWQTAFVFDPHSGEEGNFIWRSGKPDKDAILIENDEISPPEPAVETPQSELVAKIEELTTRIHRLEKGLMLLATALAFFLAFAGAWKLGYLSDPPPQPKPTTHPSAP